MKNAYIDSYQIHDYLNPPNNAWISNFTGLEFPDVRQTANDNAGEHGAFVSNNLYGGRTINIEGRVGGLTVTQYETNRRAFLSAFTLERDSFSQPIPRVFKFKTMDDLELQCEVYVQKVRFERKGLLSGVFSIDLYAPDYLLYTQALNSLTLTRASGGGAIYPVIYPVVYDATTGGSGIALNAGSAETYPLIYLNGPLNDPIILNDTLGKFIALDITLGSGDQVVIDMINREITQNGISVISNKSDESDFFWLAKGSNLLKFFTSSTSDTGNAQIQWQDAHVGS